jgi:electron transport complex protein RnfE
MPPQTPDPYQEFRKGLWQENPVFAQVLGMCPTLAVTNSAVNALVMGVATCCVLVTASLLVSSLRRLIPRPVRISSYIIIIATFVTVIDVSLQALLPTIHKELGAFIPLIVVNCLILGRQEAFASRYPVGLAVLDAVGMASGFTLALFALGSVREILGSGSWLGVPLFGPHFEPWVIMVLPPGGFLTLGLLLLLFNWVKERKDRLVERLDALEAETP